MLGGMSGSCGAAAIMGEARQRGCCTDSPIFPCLFKFSIYFVGCGDSTHRCRRRRHSMMPVIFTHYLRYLP